MITIEKNVPKWQMHRSTQEIQELTATMRQMEVGDSFFTTGYFEKFRRCAREAGIFVEARAVHGEDGQRIGWRVWRVPSPSRKSLASGKRKKLGLTLQLQRAA
jgi:hypothetical protein